MARPRLSARDERVADQRDELAPGGNVITLTGLYFPPDAVVTFGVDPDTGLGGEPGLNVVVLDANTLEVTTPAHAKGTVSVMVQDASSAQAATHAGFRFGSNDGGGGCAIGPLAPPANGPRAIALGGGWMLLLLAATILMRRGTRAARPVHA